MNHKELLKKCCEIASTSLDPSTQNGAILVNDNGEILASSNNHFPHGVLNKPERWVKPLKYQVIEHAERGSIYDAAKNGIATNGLTMVCEWAACSDCSRAIIESGIKRLVTHKQAFDRSPEFWRKEIKIALEMLDEAGVDVIYYDGFLDSVPLLHSGLKWIP